MVCVVMITPSKHFLGIYILLGVLVDHVLPTKLSGRMFKRPLQPEDDPKLPHNPCVISYDC